ncbi:MAG: hypothetical protein RIR18_1670 [Pseudomonadota bacterium]|jgi:sulfonate transport system permease protein
MSASQQALPALRFPIISLNNGLQPLLARIEEPLINFALALILPLSILSLWFVATKEVWLPPQILPEPTFVWETLLDTLQSGELLTHVWASFQRVILSLLIGGAIGLSIGFAMGLSNTAKTYLYPSFSLFAQFPVIGWAPLMIIFFGIDEAMKIATITVAVIVPFAIATYKGMENVPSKLLEVGRIYKFSFWQTLRHIALPAALPAVLGGVRQGGMQAWLALVFVEIMASSEGLGYFLSYSRNLMQLDVVMVCMLAIGAVGLLFDVGLTRLEQHFSHWIPKGF